MKKYLILFSIFLCTMSALGYTYAIQILEKKVIVKERILAHSDLKKHVNQGESYITELNAFLTKYQNNEEKLQDVLGKTQTAKSSLASTSDTFKILNYLEYSILYIFIEDNITPVTPPVTPPVTGSGVSENEKTFSEIHSLQDIIENKLDTKTLKIKDIIAEEIEEKTTENAYFLLGYPNYTNLGIKKTDYTDSFGNEYMIVVLVTKDEASFQILGYLEKSETIKTAIVLGNYVKKTNFPDSLFVEPETKKYIVSGSDFPIK